MYVFCLVFAMSLCASVYMCFVVTSWEMTDILALVFGVLLVGRICNNFEKNRAFYDKSMKLGTWLVDNKTKK